MRATSAANGVARVCARHIGTSGVRMHIRLHQVRVKKAVGPITCYQTLTTNLYITTTVVLPG